MFEIVKKYIHVVGSESLYNRAYMLEDVITGASTVMYLLRRWAVTAEPDWG